MVVDHLRPQPINSGVWVSHNTGLRRGPSRPTAGVLAVREHTRRAALRASRWDLQHGTDAQIDGYDV